MGPNGEQTEWTKTYRDMAGRVVKVEYPDEAVALWGYNAKGQLVKQVDPDGVTTLTEYDARGRELRRAIDLDDNDQIDLASDRITETSQEIVAAHGTTVRRSTTRVYPLAGNATAVTLGVSEQAVSGLASWSTAYTPAGPQTTQTVQTLGNNGSWTVTATRPDGSREVQTFTQGRLASRVSLDASDAQVSATAYAYDPHGRLLTQTDARTGNTTFAYNDRDLVVTETRPAPASGGGPLVTEFGYDLMGRRITVTLPDNTVTNTTFSPAGQVTGTNGSQTYPVSYTFDSHGRMRTMTTQGQAGNATTTWIYDEARGWLSRKEYADTKGTNYTYTPAGRLQVRTWARLSGNATLTTTYGYNAAGDMTLVDYSDATPDVVTTYTRWGAVETVTDGAGTRTMAYTPTLQPLSETHTGLLDRILTRQFDGLGRDSGFTVGVTGNLAQDHAVAYAYDGAGRLATLTGHGITHTYNYLANSGGLLANRTASAQSGFKVLHDYEPGRDVLASIENRVGNTTISRYDYSVNRIGQRTARSQNGTAFAAASADAFSYNSRGEVVGSVNDQNSALAFAYDYDLIGNRNWADELGITTNYTATLLNTYSTVAREGEAPAEPLHDDDGNELTGSNVVKEWDAENRLIRATNSTTGKVVEMTYDGQSRRVRRVEKISANATVTSDTRYLYDGWNVAVEFDVQSSTLNVQRSLVWGRDLSGTLQGAGGVGGLLSSKAGADVALFTFDGNGNVSELVDGSSGAVVGHYEYGPFGQLTASSGSAAAANSYRFSTKPFDDVAGLYYYGYRFYNPEAGRWPNRDPIGESGGIQIYMMLHNDCIGNWDMLGMMGSKTVKYSTRFSAYLEWFPEQGVGEIKVLDRGKEVARFRYSAATGTVQQVADHSGRPLKGIGASAMRKIAPQIAASLQTIVSRVGGVWIISKPPPRPPSAGGASGRLLGRIVFNFIFFALDASSAQAPTLDPTTHVVALPESLDEALSDHSAVPTVVDSANPSDTSSVEADAEASGSCKIQLSAEAYFE